MRKRDVLATFAVSLAASVLVAIVVEALRARGALPSGPQGLPQPVAPGADHV